jgi:hypothetical protein
VNALHVRRKQSVNIGPALTSCLRQGWRQKLRTRIESVFSIGVYPRPEAHPHGRFMNYLGWWKAA